MSSNYYNHRWQECINDLMEQLHDQEQIVIDQTSKKSDVEWFQFYGALYVKYVDIYRRLEDCYDQLAHPQRRVLLKQMLTNAMIRMCEVKQNVVKYSTQTNVIQSDFINFEELVMDLKLTPKCLQVPIPRFFREDDRKRIQQRDAMITELMNEFHDTAEPEEEVMVESLFLETNLQTAVRIIQKLERGRQGINRVIDLIKYKKNLQLKRNKTLDRDIQEDDRFNQIAINVQKYWRAFAARRAFHQMREGELEFLGIVKEEPDKQIWRTAQKNRQAQKQLQAVNVNKLVEAEVRIKQEIKMAEGSSIRARLLEERRKWIQHYLALSDFKLLPNKPSEFYNKEQPKVQVAKKSKKKQTAASPKKNKKGTKSPQKIEPVGPSETVGLVEKNIEDYTKIWNAKITQIGEVYNSELLKNTLQPEVESQIRDVVDSMIALELDNMRIKLGIKKKKEKRKKKAKKKKGKKTKIPFGLGKRDPRELLVQLVELNIVKFLKPAHISDLKGETNYLGIVQERLYETQPDPSYAQLREVITQNIAIPLGSQTAKDRLQKTSWFFFYGPSGSGKTLAVRAIQTQCCCMVLDLSPENLENKFSDKKELKKMFWMSIIVAKKYQPSIIMIEEVETIFSIKKKGKKGDGSVSPFGTKLKKGFIDMKKNKYWDKTDRIAVIGCSNRPYNCSLKVVKKLFHKHLYFPYANYATRKLLLKDFITQKLGWTPNNFPYSTVCQISEGFTAGSFKQAVDRVVTAHRAKRAKDQPLKLTQFVLPLANTYCTYAEQYSRLKAFTDEVTGQRERREQKQRQSLVQNTKKKASKK